MDSLPARPWSFARSAGRSGKSNEDNRSLRRAVYDIDTENLRRAPSVRRKLSEDSERAGRVWAREPEEDPWAPCILALDGGGIRGYSSLLILKELMHQVWLYERALDQEDLYERYKDTYIERALEDEERDSTDPAVDPVGQDLLVSTSMTRKAVSEEELLPCHYFDFMYGTSTGGLIALLLGRLRITVTESLDLYRKVGDDLFGKPKTHLPLMTKYHHEPLENAMREIVRTRCHEHENCNGDDMHSWDYHPWEERLGLPFDVSRPRVCHSCCLAADANPNVSEAHLLRSYPLYYSAHAPNFLTRYNEGAEPLPIWKVTRATTAAPFYFESVKVDGVENPLRDGGIRENNPSGAALSEFHALYEGTGVNKPALLLSIGTGQTGPNRDGFANVLYKRLRHVPLVSKLFEKLPVQQDLQIKYTEGEKQHQRLREYAQGEHTWYKRLSVSPGLKDIPWDDWERGDWQGQRNTPGGASLTRMEEATNTYLERDFDPAIDSYAPPITMLRQAAEKLVRQRRARERQGGPRWATFVGKHLKGPAQISASPELASAMTIEAALDTGNFQIVRDFLEEHFDIAATGSWGWLYELSDLGYDKKEIAELLFEESRDRPWILFEPWIASHRMPSSDFHVNRCVHTRQDEQKGDGAAELRAKDLPILSSNDEGSRSLQMTVMSLCGLAGIIPTQNTLRQYHSNVSFERAKSCRAVVSYGQTLYLGTNLEECRIAMERFCTAVAEVQKRNGCCNGYSIIVKMPDWDVAEMVTVHFDEAIHFMAKLQSADPQDSESLLSCARAAEKLLTAVVPLKNPQAVHLTAEGPFLSLHYCALAVQLLCLSFVSYCQGHVGALDLFFLEESVEEVHLCGFKDNAFSNYTLVARLRRLSCLDSMLNAPVFMISSTDVATDFSPTVPLDLLASPEDILDTWGPATVVTDPKEQLRAEIRCIFIGGGSIFPTSSGKYHWSREMHVSQHKDLLPLQWGDKSLIGASIDINTQCNPTEKECLDKCHSFRDPLGTYPSFWELQQRDIGAQAGQYVFLTFNATWAKRSGMTLKECQLNRMFDEMENLAFLEASFGLQVSFCSGLARRVKIRHLLAELLPIYFQRAVAQQQQWTRLQDTFNIVEELMHGDLKTALCNMSVSDPKAYEAFGSSIRTLMLALKDTGIDPSGTHFVVALLPTRPEIPLQCIKFATRNAHFWTNMLRDSNTSATFAYFTMSCLQLAGSGCRGQETSWHRQMRFLETEVYHYNDCHTSNTSRSSWTLQHGQEYPIGPSGVDTHLVLRAKVIRPLPIEDPRLLVCPSAIPSQFHKRLLRKQPRLQEKASPGNVVQRVFITSQDNLAFSFH